MGCITEKFNWSRGVVVWVCCARFSDLTSLSVASGGLLTLSYPIEYGVFRDFKVPNFHS